MIRVDFMKKSEVAQLNPIQRGLCCDLPRERIAFDFVGLILFVQPSWSGGHCVWFLLLANKREAGTQPTTRPVEDVVPFQSSSSTPILHRSVKNLRIALSSD